MDRILTGVSVASFRCAFLCYLAARRRFVLFDPVDYRNGVVENRRFERARSLRSESWRQAAAKDRKRPCRQNQRFLLRPDGQQQVCPDQRASWLQLAYPESRLDRRDAE